jgi:hypothetical protein
VFLFLSYKNILMTLYYHDAGYTPARIRENIRRKILCHLLHGKQYVVITHAGERLLSYGKG